jgi:hypothetical protein
MRYIGRGAAMNPRYDQYVMNYYVNHCLGNQYPSYSTHMLENVNMNNTGFIRLTIVNEMGEPIIINETITVYVTNGVNLDIPIMHIITTLNPIRLELPMAYELGTQIAGPEYNFSTYNIRVDAFGYLSNNIYNIRLFPNTTSEFRVEMVPISQIQPFIEERTDIPPHLRDVLPEQQ